MNVDTGIQNRPWKRVSQRTTFSLRFIYLSEQLNKINIQHNSAKKLYESKQNTFHIVCFS